MENLNIIFQEIYKILFLLVPVLVSVAMIVWLDRRVWAFVQKRQGPNVVGPFGLLQSVADALKYIFKEIIIPASSNKVIFILAPIITMTLALIAWAVIPFDEGQVLANINVGILYIFAVSSLGVYGIIMGGWASNSKYPFLGAIRSAAQMVSYEVSIGIIIINVLLCVGSLNLIDIVLYSITLHVGGFFPETDISFWANHNHLSYHHPPHIISYPPHIISSASSQAGLSHHRSCGRSGICPKPKRWKPLL